jgi:glutamate--cysteine ligase
MSLQPIVPSSAGPAPGAASSPPEHPVASRAPAQPATRPLAGPRTATARAEAPPASSPRRSIAGLTVDDVHRYAAECLPARPGPHRVGVETEWLVVDLAAPDAPVGPERTSAALAALIGCPDASGAVLTGGSRVTFEPGGQLELSGPAEPLPASLPALRGDLAAVRATLSEAGLGLAGLGLDPLRPPVRWLSDDRYASMAGYWAASGHDAGRVMMCSSASVQVNVDAGANPVDIARRWRLAHLLRPVLVAMFAASPARVGMLTGFGSSRTRMWESMDPTRTLQVGPQLVAAADLPRQWAEYLIAARLMLVRDLSRAAAAREDGAGTRLVTVRDGSTFGDWLRGAGPVRRVPTWDDLVLHATTVFPPVRPRGWLEVRYLDQQPGDGWLVAAAVAAALLDDPVASAGALAACCDGGETWKLASAFGLRDTSLRRAALSCVDLALDALARLGVGTEVLAAVTAFRDRFPARGRTPADELADRLGEVGAVGVLREQARRF